MVTRRTLGFCGVGGGGGFSILGGWTLDSFGQAAAPVP